MIKKTSDLIKKKPWIIFLLLGLVAFFWVPSGFFADGGDAIYPVSPLYSLKNCFSLINHFYAGVSAPQAPTSLIYSSLVWFFNLFGGIVFGQKILFYVLATTPGVAMFFLLDYIFKVKNAKNYQVAIFAGSLFYMANTFLILYLWRMLILQPIFLYALLPLLILFYLKSKENIRNIFWFFLVSFISSPSGSNIAFIIPIWVILFIFIIFDGFAQKRIWRELCHYFKMLGIFILANIWWILPQLILAREASGNATYADTVAVTQLVSGRTQIKNVISLLSNWWFLPNNFAGKAIYNYQVVKQLVFLPFLLAIVPLSFIRKKGKLINLYTILLPIFIILIFLLKGAAIPKGDFFLYLVEKIPYFAMFRDPMQKFGMIFVAIIALLISISLYYLLEMIHNKKIKIAFVIFIFATLFTISWPFWIGGVISNKAIDDQLSFNVKLPDWVDDVKSKIGSVSENARIISSAPEPVGMVSYNWQSGYFGGAIYPYLLEKEFIMPLSGSDRSGLVEGFYRQLKAGGASMKKIADMIGANYLFIQNDLNIDYLKKTLPSPYNNLVDNQDEMTKFADSGDKIVLGDNSLIKISDKSQLYLSNPKSLFCGSDNSYLDFFIAKYNIGSYASCGQKQDSSILILPENTNDYQKLYVTTKGVGLHSYSQNEFNSMELAMEDNLEFKLPELSENINQNDKYKMSVVNESNVPDVNGSVEINGKRNQFSIGKNDIIEIGDVSLKDLNNKIINVILERPKSLAELSFENNNFSLNRNVSYSDGEIKIVTTKENREVNYFQELPDLESNVSYELILDTAVKFGVTHFEVGYFDQTETYKTFRSIRSLSVTKYSPDNYKSLFLNSIPEGKKLYLNIWASDFVDGDSESTVSGFTLYQLPEIHLGLYKDNMNQASDLNLDYSVSKTNEYKFKLGAADRAMKYLVLNQDFSKNWKLYYQSNGDWVSVSEDQHSVYNTFANAWDISDLPAGDIEFKITYQPQKYLNFGVVIFIISLLAIIYFGFRKNEKK